MARWEGATKNDLLLGDAHLPTAVDPDKYLDLARSEIDAFVGITYQLPLPPLPNHLVGFFRTMHAKLASGRLLLAQAAVAQDRELHAYGLYLVKQAEADMAKVGTTYQIVGATPREVEGDRTPSISNPEERSPWDAYEEYVHSPNQLRGALWR